MEKGQFAAGPIALPFQHSLTHFRPVVESRSEGALDAAVHWRRKDLIQEWPGLLIGLQSDKPAVAAVSVLHQEVIGLQQLLLGGVAYVVYFLGNQSGAPANSEWASTLTVPIKMSYVLHAMYEKGTQDPLLFGSEAAKNEGHVVYTRDRVGTVATLAAGMKEGGRSSGEGRLQLSQLKHGTFAAVSPALKTSPEGKVLCIFRHDDGFAVCLLEVVLTDKRLCFVFQNGVALLTAFLQLA